MSSEHEMQKQESKAKNQPASPLINLGKNKPKPFNPAQMTPVYELSVQQCREIASYSENPRRFNNKWIQQLAHLMESNAWRPEESVIKFNKDGELVDGFHRMMAAISIDQPLKTMIVVGSTGDCTDEGQGRLYAQLLAQRGWKYSATTGAVIRAIFCLKNGSSDPFLVPAGLVKPSNAMMTKTLNSMRRLSLEWATQTAHAAKNLVSVSPAALALYQFHLINKELAEKLGTWLVNPTLVNTGTALEIENFGKMWRFFNNRKGRVGKSGTDQDRRITYSVMVKLWNSLIEGYKLGDYMVFREDEAVPEISKG